MLVFGYDFSFETAKINYKNLDRLINYVNEHNADKYFLKYSTPAIYIDAISKLNISWTVKRDDGFPNSDGPDEYWTGFFTSKPNFKAYVR